MSDFIGYVQPWTEEEEGRLSDLWKAGRSVPEIGQVLNRTKGAILGKVFRLGLPRRTVTTFSAAAKRGSQIPHSVRKPLRKYINRDAFLRHHDEPESLGFSLDQLTTQTCKYMAGDPREGGAFCGHKTRDDSCWCPYHHHLVYQPRTSVNEYGVTS